MKGKITKDIFLRVGQGVMHIPRNQENTGRDKNRQPGTAGSTDHNSGKLRPSTKVRHP